jgi:hypothetical protein
MKTRNELKFEVSALRLRIVESNNHGAEAGLLPLVYQFRERLKDLSETAEDLNVSCEALHAIADWML